MAVLHVLAAHFKNIARALARHVAKFEESGQRGIRAIKHSTQFLVRYVPFAVRLRAEDTGAWIRGVRQTLGTRKVEDCREQCLFPRRGDRLAPRAHVLANVRRRNAVERYMAECHTQYIELSVVFLARLGSLAGQFSLAIQF